MPERKDVMPRCDACRRPTGAHALRPHRMRVNGYDTTRDQFGRPLRVPVTMIDYAMVCPDCKASLPEAPAPQATDVAGEG